MVRIKYITIADISTMVLSMSDLIFGFAQGSNTRLDDTILDAILKIRYLLTNTEGITHGTTEVRGSREYVINASGLMGALRLVGSPPET